MAIPGGLGNRRAIPCAQHGLAAVFDERYFAFKQIDELIFVAVPMALAGPAAWRQRHQIDAEIAKAARLAQALPRTCSAGCIEWGWIARTRASGYGGDVDFWHGILLRLAPEI